MTKITINLHNTHQCLPGRYITQMKTTHVDKAYIMEAADLMGMTQAEFLRTVAFQAATVIHQRKGDHGQDARPPDRSASPKR